MEAYRFRGEGGRTLLAAWASDGSRLGARNADAPSARLTVGAESLAPWNGRIRVTDHLGQAADLGRPGDPSVELGLNAAPVYVTVSD